ncbi:hypothetical protein JKF63_07244 [Porcisia hertigi]|uniref:Palmitoyltransferase DHHC domain-containing protein n=1 Tax=Porcisia hertigi TaxID=2761500 RepID=A0A836LLA8_9TRYP|nr:hypothetical protein JKF63_07244 [Porcisia hertigi]
MQVFHGAIEKNGGPLPLSYYLQPDVGSTPDTGAAQGRDKPIDLDHTRVDRRTFFECLLNDADFAILTTFMMSGVPVNATRGEDGATALHVAAAGTVEALNKVTFDSGDNTCDFLAGSHMGKECGDCAEDESRGSTSHILHLSSQNQLIVSFLIDNGADINAAMRNGQGQTPLMVAAARQNTQVVKLLLAKGADLNVQDARGRTVLSYAVAYPHLMETLRVSMGEEAFHEAAARERLLHTACRSLGNIYAALYLIEQVGLDVNMRDDWDALSSTALPATGLPNQGWSAGAGTVRIDHGDDYPAHTASTPSTLFACGVTNGMPRAQWPTHPSDSSIPLTNNNGISTAFRNYNSPFGSADGVGLATTEAANADALHGGDTPLHCAVITGDVALVRALLEKGANVYAANNNGVTPLQLAQSPASRVQSWKQYWRDKLIVLLRSKSASAARHRRDERQQQCKASLRDTRSLLRAYSRATTTQSREKVLRDDSARTLWQLLTPKNVLQLLAIATLPHGLFYGCCCITDNFFVLLALLPLMFTCYLQMKRRNSRNANSCRLTGLGWWIGFLGVQGICFGFFSVNYYYMYYSVLLEDHKMLSMWLVPAIVATLALSVCVLCLSPGMVTSTEGQRKGIYASLRSVKGEYPKELLYGADLRTMVRKPLRAQYCPQIGRVVLRYDHYSFDMGGIAIGGGNHRAFVWLHVALLSLLSCFYRYACEYSRLMSQIAQLSHTLGGTAGNDEIARKYEAVVFSTTGRRFAYMHIQVALPLVMLAIVFSLWKQFWAIARNLTLYDVKHSEGESSLYCFTLGERVYSLFDYGMWANLCEFFGCSSLTKQLYRVPQINPYLQQLVTNHQRWQLSSSNACSSNHCHHQHQPESHTRNAGHTPEKAAAAAVAAGGATEIVTGAEKTACPTDWGEVGPSQPQQTWHSAPQAEEGVEEKHGADQYCGDNNSALSMQIFQEMIRVGSINISRNDAAAAAATPRAGADEQTQREWDAAMDKAREMYRFYVQSIGVAGDDY